MTNDFGAVTAAFSGRPGVGAGRMFGTVALKSGGKVFAMEVKGRLVVKLPKARVDALIASGAAERFDPGHGRVMKEWVAAPAGGGPDWVALAEEAKAFVDGA